MLRIGNLAINADNQALIPKEGGIVVTIWNAMELYIPATRMFTTIVALSQIFPEEYW